MKSFLAALCGGLVGAALGLGVAFVALAWMASQPNTSGAGAGVVSVALATVLVPLGGGIGLAVGVLLMERASDQSPRPPTRLPGSDASLDVSDIETKDKLESL